MNKIKVAVIDSGVKKEHPRIIHDSIVGFGYSNGNITDDFIDTNGHGTAIYNVIRNTDNIEILNIKVTDIENGVPDTEIIGILNYIYEKIDIDIINLSLGLSMCENLQELYDVCEKLYRKGSILVSAFDNAGSMSYPAVFENVIGVTSGGNCRKIDDFEYINDKIINVAAYGSIQRLAWASPDYILLGGNSFACAHVTAQIAKYMLDGTRNREALLDKLKNSSICHHNINTHCCERKLPYKIKNAVLFPFSKEMHSLIRYADMLEFQITAIYDSKYSATVGASTTHLLNDNAVKSLPIQNIHNINWDEFDTIILGHLDELSALINKNELMKKLICESLKHKKNIYAFDDISEFITEENKDHIYFPIVDKQNIPPFSFGKLYRISKPVLGIFGTSSKQGKFTLQLILRKLLEQKGYQVGQIGTEPTALLYGMDYVYPMGYNSSVYIKEFDAVRYLNYIMNEICMKNKDIIIVGSQSGTVPYDTGNISLFNIPQYNFLMGTQPDNVILCVNPYDEIEYINRTIKFIESSTDGKVLAIVIFPLGIKNDWTGIYGKKERISDTVLENLKENYFLHFKIPSFELKNEEISKLIEYIIEVYS
jgi:uncharacterized NAD-dependent epimerase/dehydratase family protein